jgi:hypothetical protein
MVVVAVRPNRCEFVLAAFVVPSLFVAMIICLLLAGVNAVTVARNIDEVTAGLNDFERNPAAYKNVSVSVAFFSFGIAATVVFLLFSFFPTVQ